MSIRVELQGQEPVSPDAPPTDVNIVNPIPLPIRGDEEQGTPFNDQPLYPVPVGGRASDAAPTAVDPDARVGMWVDTIGRQHVVATGDINSGDPDSLGSPPIKIGSVASTAMPPAVTEGDRVAAWFDPNGRQHVVVSTDGGFVSVSGSIFVNNTGADPVPVSIADSIPIVVDSVTNPIAIGSIPNGVHGDEADGTGPDNAGTRALVLKIGSICYDPTVSPRPANVALTRTALSLDLSGRVIVREVPEAVASNALLRSKSTALEDSRLVKAAAGMLFKVECNNTSSSVVYLQVFNKASAPTLGDTAIREFPIPAGTWFGNDDGKLGMYCSTGISIGISSTPFTFTSAGAFGNFWAGYV